MLLSQLDVEGFERLLQAWISAQIGDTDPVDTLVCDGKTLRGAIDWQKAPLQTNKRERGHGWDITWTRSGMPAPKWLVEKWSGSATVISVRSKGKRVGATRVCRLARKLCCTTSGTVGQLRTPGTGPATRSSAKTTTATANPAVFRSWPCSGAWP